MKQTLPNEKEAAAAPILRIAAAIVKYRYVIFLLFAAAAVYCALSVGRVRVNNDLTAFLPAETETRRGLSIMEDEFVTYAGLNVMVSNVTYETAKTLADTIAAIPHVTGVAFDNTAAHYTHAAAMFAVSFDGVSGDAAVSEATEAVRTLLAPYDAYYASDLTADYTRILAQEMTGVILIAAAVIMAVLLFTSRSYFEVVIFFIVFVFAGLLNMGTNFWLGEISSITNSVAIILQLALAIDYAIIFAHRYQDEAAARASEREALIVALAKSIAEISSSSLTTVSGLVALTLMQFRLGYDLGVVLSKGILCSMLTVFLLMPGLIALFPRALRRTQHRSLIMDVSPWGRFLMKTRVLFVLLFALLLPAAILCSSRTEYAFSDGSVDEIIYSERRAAMHKINDTFAPDTTVAVLLRGAEFEKEKAVLARLDALPEVKTATGLANIAAGNGHVLTDRFTPRMLAELLDIDVERAELLMRAYGVEHEEYQAIFDTSGSYEVPLVDLFLYLFELIDRGVVTPEGELADTVDELRGTLERGVRQLHGEGWDRLVLTVGVPAEGEESVALVERIRSIAQQYYDEADVLVVGDITSARDLGESYTGDSLKISLLTIAFVFLILLFTFRTVAGSAVLVFVIQGAIWINFSFPYLQHFSTSFVTNMIVSAIQMGATIDYAIVLMSRYLALRAGLDKREAMIRAVNEAFPTVLTSGSIMTAAGLLIAYRVSDVYVGHIGLAVGRGALISVILVLTVLPQLLVLFDTAIEKTRFTVDLKGEEAQE